MQMGCYGIGITRILGAAIEQNFDDQGHHLAGIDCAVRSRAVSDGLRPQRSGSEQADKLYAALQARVSMWSSTIAANARA